jgi:hypothetical protein
MDDEPAHVLDYANPNSSIPEPVVPAANPNVVVLIALSPVIIYLGFAATYDWGNASAEYPRRSFVLYFIAAASVWGFTLYRAIKSRRKNRQTSHSV